MYRNISKFFILLSVLLLVNGYPTGKDPNGQIEDESSNLVAHPIEINHFLPWEKNVSEILFKNRDKRQFDFNLSADHEKDVGTEVALEAKANLWRSKSGDTRLDSSARYSQHFGGYTGNGNAKIGGSISFSHNY